MHHIVKLTMLFFISIAIASCGGGKKESNAALNDKKATLEKLKGEQKKINDQISKLNDEIAALDSNFIKAKLVSIEQIGSGAFEHYIDLQGKIDARNSAYVAPRNGQGGIVSAVYVKQGDQVRRGQTILKLDDALARQQLVAAQQQVATVKAQLELAKTTYQRQKNLWDNNIGAEMQVLQAKAAVDQLSSQIRAAEAQAGAAKEMLSFTNVTSDISGTVDQVNIRVGEAFTGMGVTGPQISIINTSSLKLLVNVPENYIERVNVGTPITVTLPEANNKQIQTRATVVSKLIDPATRSFYVEANVPSDPGIRANQIAKVQIEDYSRPEAITIPVNTLQTDQQGKYVLVAVTENKKLIARKKRVISGELYHDRLEVKSGIANGDQIIIEGFQSIYDGQIITTTPIQ
ncbi:MAG TPA: efflux RND transporter periplasmic adaptor subunit [Niabella sp.]|nr:efflux RND transporter periplasmic adaptor subunit [Niabella sp.]HOZ97917.1 efflux RND transporter periplasmic adaptor subunit [Niabella sp.]HQW15937.1 efflux RND transporter periplasmic adaptor subunit [Niabella sp.]HQX21115.1 efflux RND transporter periplasmic adaptor subunit [Niabella sp.]HQX40563.1 efflux RND transporter periplasmic adaptor subunit [Niabella sp.]